MQPLLECPFGFMVAPIWIYGGSYLDLWWSLFGFMAVPVWIHVGPHLDFIGLHLDFWGARLSSFYVPDSIMVPR